MATEESQGQLRCYNKGCGKFYTDEDNHDGACCFHPGIPVFHDALKGWSCCRRRTTDFTDFLHIPGCTTAPHSNVKPPEPEKPPVEAPLAVGEVIKSETPPPKKISLEVPDRPSDDEPQIALKRTVTASLVAELKKLEGKSAAEAAASENAVPASTAKASSSDGDNEIPIGTKCKHNACKKTYQGTASLTEMCVYHPGVAIFHEGLKFWSCCVRRTTDFDQFMQQAGCETGDHAWAERKDPNSIEETKCRYDMHQMGNSVIVSFFAKVSVPDKCTVEANQTTLSVDLVFGGGKNHFSLFVPLFGLIEPANSSVTFSGAKVEVKLRKVEPERWKQLHFDAPKEKDVKEEQAEGSESDD